jgi:hypothetical protein
MTQPKYYGPNYDRRVLHTTDGTPSTGATLTLEGRFQGWLDSLHITLALHGPTDPPLTGPIAEQSTRAYVKAGLFEMAESYPRLYKDAVPEGKTALGLAWYFWHQAQNIFAFYGR